MAAPEFVPKPEVRSVVVIDDSPGDTYWFDMTARETGLTCAVESFPHAPAAIRYLEKHRSIEQIAAVCVSAVLPLLSLEEACREIHSIPGMDSVPIIVLVDGDHELELARRAGLTRWIRKPVEGDRLRELLETCESNQVGSPAPV